MLAFSQNFGSFHLGGSQTMWLFVLVGMVGITISQDFFESVRSGYSFHFGESLLFKTVWLFFIPIWVVLRGALQGRPMDNFYRKTWLVSVAIVVHILLTSYTLNTSIPKP